MVIRDALMSRFDWRRLIVLLRAGTQYIREDFSRQVSHNACKYIEGNRPH